MTSAGQRVHIGKPPENLLMGGERPEKRGIIQKPPHPMKLDYIHPLDGLKPSPVNASWPAKRLLTAENGMASEIFPTTPPTDDSRRASNPTNVLVANTLTLSNDHF
jgi:hypothetical protein